MRPILFAAAPLVAAPLVAALLVAALLATAPAPAWAETLLHLSEAAQIQVHPDRLAAGLRVEADGATTTEVQAKVNAGMAAALDLAKKTAGITVSTGSYSVWQVQPNPQAAKHWHAAQTLDLVGSDGAVVQTLVGTLQAQGLVVQQLGWRLAADTTHRAHVDAMQMALKQLRGRAEDAASALGLAFVSFRLVNLDPSGVAPRAILMAAPMMSGGAAMPNPVTEAADITVEVRIEADAVLDSKK